MTIFRSRTATWTSVVVVLVAAALIAGGVVIGIGVFWFDDYRSAGFRALLLRVRVSGTTLINTGSMRTVLSHLHILILRMT